MGNITLHIDLSRTGEIARRLAVTKVGLCELYKPLLSIFLKGIGIRSDFHSLCHLDTAGTDRFGFPVDLYNADFTWPGRGASVYMAKGGDIDFRLPCRLQDSQFRVNRDLVPVYNNTYFLHITNPQISLNQQPGRTRPRFQMSE